MLLLFQYDQDLSDDEEAEFGMVGAVSWPKKVGMTGSCNFSTDRAADFQQMGLLVLRCLKFQFCM